jgi:hypothetical protein
VYSGDEGPGESYAPGDEITLGVAFNSDSKITSVEVVYAHPIHRWITLTVKGSAELMEGSPTFGGDKRSRATVSGVVEEHHTPGIYTLARVGFYTFTGRSFPYDREKTRTGLGNEGRLLPGRRPDLSIVLEHGEVSDLIAELEPKDE